MTIGDLVAMAENVGSLFSIYRDEKCVNLLYVCIEVSIYVSMKIENQIAYNKMMISD